MAGGQLHQMNIEFQPIEDRLVLKINTTDKSEFRLWLTRRFAKQFWDSLHKILESSPLIKRQADPAAKKAMLAFQQEKSVRPEQFEQDYENDAANFPLGEDPVLLTGFTYVPAKKGKEGTPPSPPRMSFQTAKGLEVGLPVNDQILFSLAKLLQRVEAHTGWDLKLTLGFGADEVPPEPAKMH